MIIIAHRGNINGSAPEFENHPDYVRRALDLGFDAEVDIWYINNQLYTGHNEPQYKINDTFLYTEGLWCHAKNLDALSYMLAHVSPSMNCFWHESDKYTLTSKGYIGTYPGQPTTNGCILVTNGILPVVGISGVCTDHPYDYRTSQ